MSGYALITLNTIEYADVYLKKQRWICQNCYECIWCSTRHKVTEFIEQLPTQTYSEYCQTFKTKRFAKRMMPECRWTTRHFPGREEGFVELGHFDKHFIKNIIRAFLSKIRKPFFSVVVLLRVWLNMHQYPWICLNILENGWINCSDYARGLNMHVHLIYVAGFWMCLQF